MTRYVISPTNKPPAYARQHEEMIPGHCDSCGAAGTRLVPIAEGVFCGPAAVCRACLQLLRPKVEKRSQRNRAQTAPERAAQQLGFDLTTD